jgi:glutamyl-tRNA synthetase
MEDLDAPRFVPGAAEAILRDLEWLGIEWDGPVLTQSSRVEALRESVRALLETGRAYPCVCTRSDVLSAQGAPQVGVSEPRYLGTCRGRFASVAQAERISGKAAGVRFVVPDGVTRVEDRFAPPIDVDVQTEVGDFIIERKGGIPAYQLAVVLDDAAQGVTDVVRGDDLLRSTARQMLLQNALGVRKPETFHVPLVLDAMGRRLAKRADDTSLEELAKCGVDPRKIVAWAARTSGVEGVDCATAAEITGAFGMANVPHTSVTLRTHDADDLEEMFRARPNSV